MSVFSFILGCLGGSEDVQEQAKPDIDYSNLEVATFAGGCFWCMEPPFEKLAGVANVTAGYSGGSKENADYEKVSSGTTNHFEAVQIEYDPSITSYEKLLDVFWRQIDPTDEGGQFADRGNQYKTAIFYRDESQRVKAEESLRQLNSSGKFDKPLATRIIKFKSFYPAEEYHQDYYKKNPLHYNAYKAGSGRKTYIKDTWADEPEKKYPVTTVKQAAEKKDTASGSQKTGYSKPSDEVLRQKLTPLQYRVTQQEGTEPAFNNEYWDNKREGIYVDVVSGEPLFSSKDKYKSGTGWPSFTKPLEEDNIVYKSDTLLGYVRTEVRSKHGDSHLGHVFDDGPQPTGKRYCMNSAALRFIPKKDLEKEGYGKYANLFQ